MGEQARLAFAWIGGSADELDPSGAVPPDELFRLNKNTFETRLYGVAAAGGRASLALGLSHFNGDQISSDGDPEMLADSVGASATAIMEWPIRLGRHKLSLQYGRGAAYDFRSVLVPPLGRTFAPGEVVRIDDLWQFRLVNDFLIEQRGPWQLQAVAVWQEVDNGAATTNRIRWVSLGARPVYRLGRFFSLATEVGWDHTSQSDLPGGSLVKVTVAPQITPAVKFLSRPSLRAFATWAGWSDSFRGLVAPVSYPNSVHGVSFGVQLESWW